MRQPAARIFTPHGAKTKQNKKMKHARPHTDRACCAKFPQVRAVKKGFYPKANKRRAVAVVTRATSAASRP